MNATIFLPVNIESNSIYDILIAAAKDHLKLPDLARGNVVISDNTTGSAATTATYSTIYDPATHSLKVSKSYIKQIPGSLYGYYEVPTSEVIFELKAINALSGYRIVNVTTDTSNDSSISDRNDYDVMSSKLAQAVIEVNELKAKLSSMDKSSQDFTLTEEEMMNVMRNRELKKAFENRS